MTTIPQAIDEILNFYGDLCAHYQSELHFGIHTKTVEERNLKVRKSAQEAKLTLRQLIEEKLPKEIVEWNVHPLIRDGYRQALADVKRALDETFGEGK